jgi:hypothetical protein
VFVLSVQVHQTRPESSDQARRGRGAIDPGPVPAFPMHFSPKDEPFVVHVDPLLRENFDYLRDR